MVRTAADSSRQRATLLRRVKQIWAQLRPHEKLSNGRAVKGELSFSSLDQIVPEIGFRTHIQAIEISDALVSSAPLLKIPFGAEVPGLRKGEVSIRAHCALYDERTMRLASQAAGRDIANLPILDFDIHAVCCRLEGKPISPWPHASPGEFETKLEHILELYSAMLERIWSHFGGRSRPTFERMALWTLENGSGRSGPGNVFGAIFAADQYGNRSLALRLLDELEASWDQRMRVEADNALAQQIGVQALESVGRARRMLTPRSGGWSGLRDRPL